MRQVRWVFAFRAPRLIKSMRVFRSLDKTHFWSFLLCSDVLSALHYIQAWQLITSLFLSTVWDCIKSCFSPGWEAQWAPQRSWWPPGAARARFGGWHLQSPPWRRWPRRSRASRTGSGCCLLARGVGYRRCWWRSAGWKRWRKYEEEVSIIEKETSHAGWSIGAWRGHYT